MRLPQTELDTAIHILAQSGHDPSSFDFACEDREQVGTKKRAVIVSAQDIQRTYDAGAGTNWIADFGKDLAIVWPVRR